MTFVTAGLPFGGLTTHFAVQYDDALTVAAGRDLAIELLGSIEQDFDLMQNWFAGVNFQFALPLDVYLTGEDGGAGWLDPPDIALGLYHIPVTLKPGPHPSVFLLRYLLVSEVTEMFMASQRKDWFGPTGIFWGANERSIGEALSRFLAAEFFAPFDDRTPSGFGVTALWLNSASRMNWVDTSTNDIDPNDVNGCEACFLFFLRYQLGFSIQQIIAASAPTMAAVYTKLTGQTDGWTTFKALVDAHYPPASEAAGSDYFPPMDNLFPVADLNYVDTARELTWVENYEPHRLRVSLTQAIPLDVHVALTSDNPTIIEMTNDVLTSHLANVRFVVHSQPAAFTETVVTLTGSYAGQDKSVAVRVVRPENLRLPALVIQQIADVDPCKPLFVEGGAARFRVKNIDVIADRHGLGYEWTVTGGVALQSTADELKIPVLPAAGSAVAIKVVATARSGIHAEGTFSFTTQTSKPTLLDQVRALDCWVRRQSEIQAYVPPWVPIEDGRHLAVDPERLAQVQAEARRAITAARTAVAAAKTIAAQVAEQPDVLSKLTLEELAGGTRG
jgi:hypothetical protein